MLFLTVVGDEMLRRGDSADAVRRVLNGEEQGSGGGQRPAANSPRGTVPSAAPVCARPSLSYHCCRLPVCHLHQTMALPSVHERRLRVRQLSKRSTSASSSRLLRSAPGRRRKHKLRRQRRLQRRRNSDRRRGRLRLLHRTAPARVPGPVRRAILLAGRHQAAACGAWHALPRLAAGRHACARRCNRWRRRQRSPRRWEL